MKLLLDTHIWIWGLADPQKLHRRVKRALRAPEAEIWLSPVSLWEFQVLVDRQRVQVSGNDAQAWIDAALHEAPMKEAPLTHAIVRTLGAVKTPHRDPADRFLAATAATLDLTLVTADERLLQGTGYQVLSNL